MQFHHFIIKKLNIIIHIICITNRAKVPSKSNQIFPLSLFPYNFFCSILWILLLMVYILVAVNISFYFYIIIIILHSLFDSHITDFKVYFLFYFSTNKNSDLICYSWLYHFFIHFILYKTKSAPLQKSILFWCTKSRVEKNLIISYYYY